MIELINVSKDFSGRTVFSNISCIVKDKGITAVTGPSGSGKTTLARIISGLDTSFSGEIKKNDCNRITYVFQEDRLLESLNAVENVAIVSDREKAVELLTLFGLGDDLEKKPSELSGGMKRRVAVARALAFGGDLLVADEPFRGLDEDIKKVVFDEIKKFSKLSAVLLITHDSEDIKSAVGIINLG